MLPGPVGTPSDQPVETEDSFAIHLDLASGAQASIVNYMTVGAGPGNRYEVYGSARRVAQLPTVS